MMMFTSAAQAEEDTQLIAFTEGRYLEAANLAQASGSANDLAFAARSLLAHAMCAEDFMPPQPKIMAAEALAREALALDASHIEARLQLAIALSLRARPLSTREAMRTGYADDAKKLVESVLADHPTDPYANGFMAVWHIEVRRRGGAFGASIMGASIKKARRHYQAAVRSLPGDASTHWQYARALTALNARKYRSEIDQALNAAIAAPIDSKLEKTMQERAKALRAVLQSEGRRAAEKRAEKML